MHNKKTSNGVKNDKKILWLGIILYVVIMTGASFWKYELFRYNAIDLAYYNQVFWETIHGNLFGLTIHPHLSLGDHVEPFLLLLAPLYALWPDARTLLFLQSLVLGLTALPIYSIVSFFIATTHNDDARSGATLPSGVVARAGMDPANGGRASAKAVSALAGGANEAREGAPERAKRSESATATYQKIPLLFALLWLANPLVHNINLMEFHILPFALPFLFLAILAYEKKHVGRFILWSLLALTVREDVFLAIGAFTLLALFDVFKKKRSTLWIFVPLLLALPWFFLTQKIASLYAAAGAYKFLVYYAWLGNTFTEIFLNIFRHPIDVLAHIATGKSLLLFLALGIPFLFLFVLRPRYLLLTLPALAEQLLASYGGDPLVAQTHYVTLLLPGLILATMATIIEVDVARSGATLPSGVADGSPATKARFARVGTEQAGLNESACPVASEGLLWGRRQAVSALAGGANEARGGAPERAKRSASAMATNKKFPLLTIPLLTIATLYGMVTPLGPLYGIVTKRVPREEHSARASILSRIPPNASVATTESFLTPLSRRDNVFLLRYIFAGETQFGGTSYSLPESTEYILLDVNDMIPYKTGNTKTVRTALAPFGVIAADGSFVLLQKGTGESLITESAETEEINDTLQKETPCSVPPRAQCTHFTLTTKKDPRGSSAIQLGDGTLLPLAYGLAGGAQLTTHYWLPYDTDKALALGNTENTVALAHDRAVDYRQTFIPVGDPLVIQTIEDVPSKKDVQ